MWSVRRELWDVSIPLLYDTEGRPLMVGRDEECKMLITDTVEGKWNVLIYGKTGYGKTTLLKWLYETIGKTHITIQIPSNVKAKTDTRFNAEITKGLLNYVLSTMEAPSGEISERTREYAKSLQKEVVNARGLSSEYYADVFFQLLDMLEEDGVLMDDKGNFTPIYYLWDDVNYLADSKFEILHLRDVLKSFISGERRIRFGFTIQFWAYAELEKSDWALLRRFSRPHIGLAGLTEEKSRELLLRRIKASRIVDGEVDEWYPFTERTIDFIVMEAEGVPATLIDLGRFLIVQASYKGLERIDEKFAKEQITKYNKESAARFLEKRDPQAYEIYITLKKMGGCGKLEDILKEVRMSRSTVWRILKKYIDEKVYFRNPQRGIYCIEDA